MSLQRAVSILLVALVASAAAMTWGAARSADTALAFDPFTLAGAAVFVGCAIGVSFAMNAPVWALPTDRVRRGAAPLAAMRNGVILALVYAWGTFAMIGIYRLSGLHWQHGLQYAAGMALLGLVHVLVARGLASPGSRWHARWTSPTGRRTLLQLTALEGAAAAAGLAFLIYSGKIASRKPDWAANIVFLTGGLAVVALCVIAVITHRRLQA